VESSRQIKDRQVEETRYCISDEEGLSAACFNSSVRGHWSIELARYRQKKLIRYYQIDRKTYYKASEVQEFLKTKGKKPE
jgi:hypothetical protein